MRPTHTCFQDNRERGSWLNCVAESFLSKYLKPPHQSWGKRRVRIGSDLDLVEDVIYYGWSPSTDRLFHLLPDKRGVWLPCALPARCYFFQTPWSFEFLVKINIPVLNASSNYLIIHQMQNFSNGVHDLLTILSPKTYGRRPKRVPMPLVIPPCLPNTGTYRF